MEFALMEIAAEAAALERREEILALKKVAAVKKALSSAEEKMASMNSIRAMVRETNLLKAETFSDDDDADIVVEEWINRRNKLFNDASAGSSSSLEQQAMNHSKETSWFQNNQKVCFVPENNTTVLIESSVEFSEKEIKRYWYSEEEVQKMRKRCNQVAEQLESGETKRNRHSCSRGLEVLTTQGMENLLLTVATCVKAVMDEQGIQWSSACEDHDRLAVVSQEVSKYSMDQAIKRAINDEKEARKIHRKDHRQKLNHTGPPILKASRTLAVLGTKSRYRITTRS